MRINLDDLEDLARGAALLGTGGGGDPYIGSLLLRHAIAANGPPEVVEVEDLDDDAMLFGVAMLGAPTVLYEKGACGDDMELAVRRLGERIGRTPDAIIPIEIGGVNSTLPIAAAAITGLPIVNADGMGRAFPEVQMVSYSIYGVSPTPAVVVDEHLNSVIVDTDDPLVAENIIRAVAIRMGLSVVMSCFAMTGREAKQYALRGTLTLALNAGRAIADSRKSGDPVSGVIEFLRGTEFYKHASVLFEGKVSDLHRETAKGFALGHCRFTSLENPADELVLEFQNEFLVARRNGTVKAIVPDLICVVDRQSGEPIPVETLKYGQRVKVIGISAAPILRTPEALEVVGPRAFGLNEDFVPIEEIPE